MRLLSPGMTPRKLNAGRIGRDVDRAHFSNSYCINSSTKKNKLQDLFQSIKSADLGSKQDKLHEMLATDSPLSCQKRISSHLRSLAMARKQNSIYMKVEGSMNRKKGACNYGSTQRKKLTLNDP